MINLWDIDRRIQKTGFKIIIGVCVILCALIGWVGVFIGNELSFAIFYVIPVMTAAWYAGKTGGIFISVFAALTWLSGDLLGGRNYTMALIPFVNAAARTVLFLIIAVLALTVRKYLTGETKSANEDFLTKISNSRAFFRYAEMELKRLKRYRDPFTIAYFDVDNFKTVNDLYGHKAGDELLTKIAYTIRKSLRPTDMVARLGGDEFAILLIETKPEQAKSIIKKINRILKNLVKTGKHAITFSFGVVTFLTAPASVDDMIKKADDMMYMAKRNGKDMVNYSVYR
jgi:diguanylate cyclase (GGDEF)-like protein